MAAPKEDASSEGTAAPALALEDGSAHSGVDDGKLRLDSLGPVVLNSDGTISRIANWDKMTPAEQERTQRIVARRNEQRRKRLEAEQAAAAAAGTSRSDDVEKASSDKVE